MKAFLNWSGGKDSALCFWAAQREGLEVAALVTTVRDGTVPMHGITIDLLQAQAAAMNIPLRLVHLEAHADYEAAVGSMNRQLRSEGFTHALSGDLFLEDLKSYRKALYARDGLQAQFPLWLKDEALLLQPFIEKTMRARIVSVNGDHLPKEACGKDLDAAFLQALPEGVDRCGERGEYHSFVYDAPFFRKPIAIEKGKVYEQFFDAPRGRGKNEPIPFYFCEVKLQRQEKGNK